MSILSKLTGQPEPWAPEKGINISIMPLGIEEGLSDFLVLEEMGAIEDMAAALGNILRNTLKKSVPGATDAEISTLGIKYLPTLMKVVLKVNGLDQDASNPEKIAKIKEIQKLYQKGRKKKE